MIEVAAYVMFLTFYRGVRFFLCVGTLLIVLLLYLLGTSSCLQQYQILIYFSGGTSLGLCVKIYYYNGFQASVDSAKLYNDLRWNATRPQALEAIMRVRCSQVFLDISYRLQSSPCLEVEDIWD